MGWECDVYKQIDVIISDSLLPKEYEMEFFKITYWWIRTTINAQLMVTIYRLQCNWGEPERAPH